MKSLTLSFDDGVKIDVGGKLRIIRERDGLYVVGNGYSIPVMSREEGNEVIKELS